VERVDRAVAHGAGHDLVLNLRGLNLLASFSNLDEVNFEGGLLRRACHNSRVTFEFVSVREDLQGLAAYLIQELRHFGRCNYALSEIRGVEQGCSYVCDVLTSWVFT